jgi:hypothetical protein
MSINEHGFSQIGGARLDSWNLSFPFAKLSALRNAIALSCMGQNYVFPWDNIVSLARYQGVFSVGLRINHNVPSRPDLIVFWISTFRNRNRRHFASLKRRPEALGFEVNE